jgi:hypothetical protein
MEKTARIYCFFNAIKTPDGTVLWSQHGHDYKTHKDTVSGEEYMTDGIGYMTRRSVNVVPYEDLSIFSNDPFEKVRTAKFWGSYGKDGKSERRMMAAEEMEGSHITAILDTQKQIVGTEIEKVFLMELEYRAKVFSEKLNEELPAKGKIKSKKKI